MIYIATKSWHSILTFFKVKKNVLMSDLDIYTTFIG